MPIDETIGQSLGNESLEENTCILGVPKIWAGAEPELYKLYLFLLIFFLFQLTQKTL